MKARIVNFRQGANTKQYTNQMLIKIDGISNREDAKKLLKKTFIFKTETGKKIKSVEAHLHGNSGVLRVRFEKGMPGQSLGKEVEVQ